MHLPVLPPAGAEGRPVRPSRRLAVGVFAGGGPAAQGSGKARRTITAETRTLQPPRRSRRDGLPAHARSPPRADPLGTGGREPRLQNLLFNTGRRGPGRILARIDSLESRGFLDATAG